MINNTFQYLYTRGWIHCYIRVLEAICSLFQSIHIHSYLHDCWDTSPLAYWNSPSTGCDFIPCLQSNMTCHAPCRIEISVKLNIFPTNRQLHSFGFAVPIPSISEAPFPAKGRFFKNYLGYQVIMERPTIRKPIIRNPGQGFRMRFDVVSYCHTPLDIYDVQSLKHQIQPSLPATRPHYPAFPLRASTPCATLIDDPWNQLFGSNLLTTWASVLVVCLGIFHSTYIYITKGLK